MQKVYVDVPFAFSRNPTHPTLLTFSRLVSEDVDFLLKSPTIAVYSARCGHITSVEYVRKVPKFSLVINSGPT